MKKQGRGYCQIMNMPSIWFKLDWTYLTVVYCRSYCQKLVNVNPSERDRHSPPGVFLQKVVLKVCSKFTEHPCRSVMSIKWLCNFIEIILRHGCSSVTLLDIFITHFPKNISGGLLLKRAVDFYQSYTIVQWMHHQDLSN